jgi:hypothetical protein
MFKLICGKIVFFLFVAYLNNKLIKSQTIVVSQFQQTMLNAINSVRTQHSGTKIVQLDSGLSSNSQTYSDTLASTNNGLYTPSANSLTACGKIMSNQYPTISQTTTSGANTCGESYSYIAATANTNTLYTACDPNAIVQLWNSQRIFYNYTNPANDSASLTKFADFTQLVW